MKPFLSELAEKLLKDHPQPGECTVVFPNRRAALYFRKYMAQILKQPAFAPELLTIEDFISGFSEWHVPDKLELIYRLYTSYIEVVKNDESFDRFHFWGEMLLRDFEEMDKYLVRPEYLFKDLTNQKEIDTKFEFLTEEQVKFLQSFWGGFEENSEGYKRQFIQLWKQLPEVHKVFQQQLREAGLAYEGMLHREVAESLDTLESRYTLKSKVGKIWFVGFNALTRTEERIITHFVKQYQAQMHWDVDDYYLNNKNQEAGEFFREYQQHPVLSKTFQVSIPSNFRNAKVIQAIGAAQPVGQAKTLGQVLQEQLAKGTKPEETLIVLPDERMMLPVLHSISPCVDKLNVTMGFSLSNTPMFNLIEVLIELQTNRKGDAYNHRQVLAVLGHPYLIAADPKSSQQKRKQILEDNLVQIPGEFLRSDHVLHQHIFSERLTENILPYIREAVILINSLDTIDDFDREYAFHFLRFFNRMEDLLGATYDNLRSFLRLFRQLVRAQKIPFVGEPLRGLQVMGVLETRNLDFKNVFVMSLNEGVFPSGGSRGSYIPYNIRKAYGLPTVEHQDAIYAYLFYRVLQRAENIFLFYNSETDVLGQGEMSRYLRQILFESGSPVKRVVQHNAIQPLPIKPIVIQKDAAILEQLTKLNEGNVHFKGISPFALNMYVECRLKFYFHFVAHIREPDEIEEDPDARYMGIFLHDVMEMFYKRLKERKGNKLVEKGDFTQLDKVTDELIDEAFRKTYQPESSKKMEYEGQRLVVREVVKKFALRILEKDLEYAPFTIEAIEQTGLLYSTKISQSPGYAVVGGKIDRVDRKDNSLRIIDYKTGRDKLEFESVASLFEQSDKRNKAAFQTFLYTLLYRTNNAANLEGIRLVPGLINRMNLFDDSIPFGFTMVKQLIVDAADHLPEFEERLKNLLEEVFNPDEKFDQTPVTESCRYCPYQGICYR